MNTPFPFTAPSRLLRGLVPSAFCLTLSLGLLLSGCASDEIKQYRVAKVAEKAVMDAPAANSPFTYTTPTGWEKQNASAMRAASFSIKGGGDVSVVTLPGMAGDLKGNVNRWRGQVGLAAIADEQAIEKMVAPVSIDGTQGVGLELYSAAGQPDKAMRVVLLQKAGMTWFFKLAGPGALVKQQKQAFESFTKSIKIKADTVGNEPAQSEGMPPMDAGAPPHPDSGSPMGTQAMPIAPQTSDTTLSYKVPGSWKEKPPGEIRVASFEASQGQLVGDVSIVNLAGDGGGLLSNTNRWRQQLEMVPTDQKGLKNLVKDITVDGHKGYFMALYTGMKDKGMLVALIEQGGQTWFVKMLAPSKLIQSQQKDFEAFVQSIQFHAKGSQT